MDVEKRPPPGAGWKIPLATRSLRCNTLLQRSTYLPHRNKSSFGIKRASPFFFAFGHSSRLFERAERHRCRRVGRNFNPPSASPNFRHWGATGRRWCSSFSALLSLLPSLRIPLVHSQSHLPSVRFRPEAAIHSLERIRLQQPTLGGAGKAPMKVENCLPFKTVCVELNAPINVSLDRYLLHLLRFFSSRIFRGGCDNRRGKPRNGLKCRCISRDDQSEKFRFQKAAIYRFPS